MSHSLENKADLIANRQALLDLLFQEEELDEASGQNIPRRQSKEPLQLSFAQQRLWFLDQWEPGSSTYNLTTAVRLTGLLNFAALEGSLNEIVRRHEALRTTFATADGQPVQVVASPKAFALPVMSLQHLLETEREAEAERLVNDERSEPFDLIKGPLFRPTLLQLKEEEHILLLAMHHIVSDGWSMGILSRELTVLYEAFSAGHPARLPELSIQYGDYAVWQRQWLQGEVLERQLSYWKKQLAGVPVVLNLPTDRPRPSVQSYRGARQSFELSEELTSRLKILSRKHHVTLFMTLLAAFQTLLCRYTGQEDIVIGSPVANRNRTEIESLIGFFVNTLVLRSDLSGNPSFAELLAQVRDVALGAYAHQDVPFEKLVEELQPQRSLSHSPLFQVMFVFQNAPGMAREFGGLTFSSLAVGNETAKFDLTLSMREEAKRLRGSVAYSTDLFDAPTIDRMVRHFGCLLQGIVADPEQRISDLSMLTAGERHQLLVEWNDTKRDYPENKRIHELFAERARRLPEAVAVVFEDQQLTYGELNGRANQLAHYLRKLGVGPEVLVGICMDRSLEMIIGLLGILKAGGAYVPLDPEYPKERLRFMLEDTQAPVLLTQQRLSAELVQEGKWKLADDDPRLSNCNSRIQVVCLDTDWNVIAQESKENPLGGVTGDNLAYLIYTSGSTGSPKGVMVTHRGISNRLLWAQDVYQLTSADRGLQKTPFGFDVSVWEFFWPLLLGARLIIARPQGHRDADYLVRLINEQEITTLHFVPSMLRIFLEERRVDTCKCLKRIICSGETLSLELQERLFSRLGAELYNLYGPTEASIDVTWWVCGRRSTQQVVPIGHPIANTQIYVLDSHLQPVPIGVAGGLYIGGIALARGYLNRADLTAEKFIPHPFSDEPGARLYKTGDMARYLPDGSIEFLGRIDNQVKIRGYRIELGEVEAVLSQHPAVLEALVVIRDDAAGSKKLVAYVVDRHGCDISVDELRSFLKQKLPEYMIPSVFVVLEALPLTPSGKVDRKALPDADQRSLEFERPYYPPRTPVEEVLAEIWAAVLSLEKVGIHDNFFDLGGHSLLATQVVSRIRRAFQLEISLRSLFEAPTVAGLAERIGEIHQKERGLQTLPLVPVSRDSHLPLSFAQQRLWFLDQLEPGSSVYNVPRSVRLRGPLNIGALEQSLNEVVRRHEILRTTFSMVEGEPVQVITPSQSVSVEVIELSDRAEAEREAKARSLSAEEARRPFNLSQGPLLRVKLLRLGKQDHILALTLHHIVSDGWSMGVMQRELWALYQAFSNNRASVLPELSIQYADYSVWQRQWLHSDKLAEQIDYWKKQLDGAPRLLELPTDHPRPSVQTHIGAGESRLLPTDLSERVRTLGRKENATLFMTLLAVFGILLHRYTGEDDIVVGTPIAGRNRQEIEGLIGFFLNHLVLRIDLSGHPSFRELLHRVRDTALGAYVHQDLPFERLLEELQPQRDLSRTPLFQVYFNMLELEEPGPDLPGITVEPVLLSEPESKFDLTLYVKPGKKSIHFNLVYNPSLFSRPRMVAMLQQLEQVLSQLVDNPEIPIDQLSLVTSASVAILPNPSQEQNEDWHGAIHERLSQQARIRPSQLALRDPWEDWRYETLELRSNQLANYLRAGGIQSEDIVAIYGHRSAALVCAMLGILKAGAAFLILDPAYPASRSLDCVQQANPRGWLHLQAAGRLPDAFKEFTATLPPSRRIELPRTSAAIAELFSEFPVDNPGVRIVPDSLAYVSFTSGSTGRPKGVLGRHGPLTHFLPWQEEAWKLTASDRFSLLSGLAHDPLQRDIFTPLWVGATLCVPDPDIIGTSKLASWMAAQGITFAHLTPPMLNLIADTTELGQKINSLRYAFFVGDSLSHSEVERARCLSPQVTCIASYGTTETQRAVGYYVIGPDCDRAEHRSKPAYPLGHGIEDTQLLVLNPARQQAGIGEVGEVYVRSPHLARGYLNDDALTATKFLSNPFTKNNRDRLYSTGDLGRYLSDGAVEFVGRIDDQVKIHGYRIELGEIESVLNQHAAVRETVALACADVSEHKRLVAYVVPLPEVRLTPQELRRFLKGKLPEYMIPSAFVLLESLPVTPNGKLDRKALPAPDQSSPDLEKSFVGPRTGIEELLAQIWAEVLKLEKVGIYDNFFDLGGHSLSATRVISKVFKTFQLELPLKLLFLSPTVAEMAAAITEQQEKRLSEKEMENILTELESLTDEEAQRALLNER